jgi:hypothetical protein
VCPVGLGDSGPFPALCAHAERLVLRKAGRGARNGTFVVNYVARVDGIWCAKKRGNKEAAASTSVLHAQGEPGYVCVLCIGLPAGASVALATSLDTSPGLTVQPSPWNFCQGL